MSIKNAIINYLEEPDKINTKKFCEKYLATFEQYLSLADEELMKAIDDALQTVLVDKARGKASSKYTAMPEDRIKREFIQRKIKLLDSVPDDISQYARKQLNELLKRNSAYALKCEMVVPQGKDNLKTWEYYLNYLIAEQMIKVLSMEIQKK